MFVKMKTVAISNEHVRHKNKYTMKLILPQSFNLIFPCNKISLKLKIMKKYCLNFFFQFFSSRFS